MPHYDLPLADLRTHRCASPPPADLDDFWQRALGVARERASGPVFEPYEEAAYGALAVDDVTFTGADGHPIKAWFLRPRGATGQLPCRVTFIGYGGGRNLPLEHALYAAAGYAVFVMDSRSQGGEWKVGHTPDPGAGFSGPEHPGVLTRGVLDPETYYFRRLYLDAVRAVETAAAHPQVDADRIAVAGASQGGGLSLAAAALAPELVRLCHADIPFLCDIERAITLAPDAPYTELAQYLALHTDLEAAVARTVRYIDNALLAPRIRCRTLISCGLMDTICPPSTVFAAYNAVTAPKDIGIFTFAGHETPIAHQERQLAEFAGEMS
ncbi:MAG: cephalosporin-C deacetylase [Gaiellaceae bacterium]|nr:cephalosporin-C deacetylase [Gaiellaceae bacterium]